jgi:beta-glucanase (GH16 family)
MMSRKARGLLFGLAALATAGLAAPADAALSLVWSDEFDGTSLDTTNWSYDIGDGCPSLCGWGNNELQYYRSQNVEVSGGNLIITARQQSYGGRSFTSGKIHTRDKHSFLYGRIEMRAKLPTGGGMWPAFWMMPQNSVYGGWAASGEIDIMESANDTDWIGGAIHYGGGWPDNVHASGTYAPGGVNFADDFHVYAIEWEPERIRWYVDDTLYFTRYYTQWYSDGDPGNPYAPFDQDFYIILNAAVGGNYTGCTDTWCIEADLPQQYVVDYVRVYQETGNLAPTVEITSPTEGDDPPAGDIAIHATAADEDGTVTTVEFYEGGTYLGEDTTAPYSLLWTSVADGCYAVTARAVDDGGASGEDTVDVTVGAGCGQGPYGGSPFVPPVRIEAEDFDVGGEGVAYHDSDPYNAGSRYRPDEGVDIEVCSDVGGGYNVGWIGPDEWLEFTVDVPVAGEYPLEVRVSSLSGGGTFRLEFDGVDETGEVAVPATGGWQLWTTVTATAALEAGPQIMRFVATSDGYNLNYLEFQEPTTAVEPDLQELGYRLHPCYPNPFNPSTTISYDLPDPSPVRLVVVDVSGRLVRTLAAGEVTAAGRHAVVWNGRDDAGRVVAAGVYFCRLDAGVYSETRRLAFVK